LAIVRWTPANDLAGLHSAMDRLFGDIFGDAFGTSTLGDGGRSEGGRQSRRPVYHLPVNIKEAENGYVIEAPVPGFKPEEVEVTFSDGVLTISAHHEEGQTREEGNYLRREVAMGSYTRQISLPGDVQADNIKASFENGVLKVEVPRAPKPEPRRIEVQPGEREREMAGASSSNASASSSNE
jgi:HSP20 family protein